MCSRSFCIATSVLSALTCSAVLAQQSNETLLSTENAYNPIPSPDAREIAYVRVGWGGRNGITGFGRSNLATHVAIASTDGHLASSQPNADEFLSLWASDGRLVTYRDGSYSIISEGKVQHAGQLPLGDISSRSERVSYIPGRGIIWSQRDDDSSTIIQSPKGEVAEHGGWLGDLLAPSPDGRYIAVTGSWSGSPNLWVYDTQTKGWVNLGEAEIHPDANWDYIKPSWNPWFSDSSRLVYFTRNNTVLSISTADGKRRTDIQIDGTGGLAAPSPDGKSVAYITFERRPSKLRPDLPFWGGTRIWLVPLSGKHVPTPITPKNPEETYDLRWLNSQTLVFDRISDDPLYQHARIWKIDIGQ